MNNPTNKLPDKTLVLSPHRLFSLWDMIQFHAIEILNILAALDHRPQIIPTGPLAENSEKKRIQELVINKIHPLCQRLELDKTRQQSLMVLKRLDPNNNLPSQVLKAGTSDLRDTLCAELCDRMFLFVPAAKAQFFEQDALFGKSFHDTASPEVNSEIKAVGNCLSCDLNTAAVFHLMRMAEFGLRQLAHHLKVKKVKRNVPLEFGTLDEILKAVGLKITTLAETTRGQKRQSDLEFYSALLIDMRGFKDFWRNNVMHSRDSYDANAAMSAFGHVRDFMLRLATRVPMT